MRRIFPFAAGLFLLFLFFVLRLPVSASSSVVDKSDRVIVRFQSNISEQGQTDTLKNVTISKKEKLRLSNTFVITVPQGTADVIASKLDKDIRIQYAEKDQVANVSQLPNDPDYQYQWGLPKIHADLAWDTTHGSPGAVVAIVDTGIDGNHPDLASKIIGRANFTTDSDIDDNGHGSHVAGIAAADTNNSVGVSGTGYDTQLLSVKVLDGSGSGYYSWVANGITWAADNGAKIINLSLGGSFSSSVLQDAVNYAWGKGVVVVAAAGNNGNSLPSYPAYYPNVVSVAATDSTDTRASFSNYGKWVTLAAPGVSIFSTYQGGYAYLSGTSMATPFVSAVAALIYAVHPGWTNSQVVNKLEQSADMIAGTGKYWVYGRVDACTAVDCGGVVTPTVTPTATLTPTPTVLSTLTPTSAFTPTPSLTPTPALPTPTPTKPWWCPYAPWYPTCK